MTIYEIIALIAFVTAFVAFFVWLTALAIKR